MKDKVIKLLIFGSENINPINIVLNNLKKYNLTTYIIDGLNLHERKDKAITYNHFDNIRHLNYRSLQTLSFIQLIKLLKAILVKKKHLGKTLQLIFSLQILKSIHYLRKLMVEKDYLNQHLQLFKNYDLINVHYVSEVRANIIANVPIGCKVILSFWGSDLMAGSGINNYIALYKAISRADIITVLPSPLLISCIFPIALL